MSLLFMDELARELDVLTSSQKMETVSIHLSQGCKGVWTPSHSLHCCHRGANILVNVIIPAPPRRPPQLYGPSKDSLLSTCTSAGLDGLPGGVMQAFDPKV